MEGFLERFQLGDFMDINRERGVCVVTCFTQLLKRAVGEMEMCEDHTDRFIALI